MSDKPFYDQYGNYIGPDSDSEDDNTTNNTNNNIIGDNPQNSNNAAKNQMTLFGDYDDDSEEDDDVQQVTTKVYADAPNQLIEARTQEQLYGADVEVIIQHHDQKTQYQPLLDPLHTKMLSEDDITTSSKHQTDSGYGSHLYYHMDYIHAEEYLPDVTFYQDAALRKETLAEDYVIDPDESQHSPQTTNYIQELLPQQWLLRNVTLLGGHLHGKTSIIDLFAAQTHSAIEALTLVHPHTAKHGGNQPRNRKPTAHNNGKCSVIAQPQGQNCWPIQYADSLHRERAVGYTTTSKTMTLPVTTLLTKFKTHILGNNNIDNNNNNNNNNTKLQLHKYLPEDPLNMSTHPAADTQPFSYQNRTYLFNLHDIPAHSQYIDQASISLQRGAQSGGVIILDCVEGLTKEVELQLENAIKFSIPLVLVLNKFDRLITELRLPPQDCYMKLLNLLEGINATMLLYYTTYHGTRDSMNPYKCPFFSPIENNVVFVSTLHCWAFTLQTFAELHFHTQTLKNPRHSVYTERDILQLSTMLWGNVFWDGKAKQFVKQRNAEHQTRSFIEFILNPLYKLYSTCFTGNADLIYAMAIHELGIPRELINPHAITCGHDELFREVIGKWLFSPYYHQYSTNYTNAFYTAVCISQIIIKTLPPPIVRKSIFQQQSLLFRPQLSLLQSQAGVPDYAKENIKLTPQQLAQLTPQQQLQYRKKHDLAVNMDFFKNTMQHFPPARVSLAELLHVIPHPNGRGFDYLCRVHTLTINNKVKPSGLNDAMMEKLNTLPAFKLNDVITFQTTTNQKYSYPHRIVGMYTPASYRYRIPITQCYDNNVVILSFENSYEKMKEELQNNATNNDDVLSQQQATTNTNNIQITTPIPHGTFINNTITNLTTLQQMLIKDNITDLQLFIPTFLRPELPLGNNIFQLSIEPTVANELPLLLAALQRAQLIYGNALTLVRQNTGCHTIQTRGEFIADDIIHYLRTINKNLYLSNQGSINLLKLVPAYNNAQLSFSVSTPFYDFREGVADTSAFPNTARSLEQYNKIAAVAEVTKILPPKVDSLDWAKPQNMKENENNNRNNNNNNNNQRNNKRYNNDKNNIANTPINPQQIPDNHVNLYNHLQYKRWFSTNDATITDIGNNNNNIDGMIDNTPTSVNQINRCYHLYKKYGWDDIASSFTPWSYGLLHDANVMLLDDVVRTSSNIFNQKQTFEELTNLGNSLEDEYFTPGSWSFDSVSAVVNGFNGMVLEGPLTESPLHNTTIKLTELSLNKNPLRNNNRYIIPTIRRAISGAMLLATPCLYEPMVIGEIITKDQHHQVISKCLGERRGAITTQIPIPATPYKRLVYKVPAIESMGLQIDVKVLTQGQSKISGYHHIYQQMDGDPLDSSIPVPILKIAPPQHLPRELLVKTRKKKGLPEFSLEFYFDQEMLDLLQQTHDDDGEEDAEGATADAALLGSGDVPFEQISRNQRNGSDDDGDDMRDRRRHRRDDSDDDLSDDAARFTAAPRAAPQRSPMYSDDDDDDRTINRRVQRRGSDSD